MQIAGGQDPDGARVFGWSGVFCIAEYGECGRQQQGYGKY